jgi:putative transposase
MGNVKSVDHTRWDCKYHLLLGPKCRRRVLKGQFRKHIQQALHDLAGQKESKILAGHLQGDHVHMLVSIPPKYSVSQVVGFIKSKSAIHISRNYWGRCKNFKGGTSGPGATSLSKVGADEVRIREYIQNQEEEDARSINWDFSSKSDRR